MRFDTLAPRRRRATALMAAVVASTLASCEDDPDSVGEAAEELGDEVEDAAEEAEDEVDDRF